MAVLASSSADNMSSAITTVMNLVPTVINAIMNEPVLAVFFCAGVIGIVIGIVKRLK